MAKEAGHNIHVEITGHLVEPVSPAISIPGVELRPSDFAASTSTNCHSEDPLFLFAGTYVDEADFEFLIFLPLSPKC